MEIMTVNSREFVVKKLLGKGKSGLFSRHYHKILGYAQLKYRRRHLLGHQQTLAK